MPLVDRLRSTNMPTIRPMPSRATMIPPKMYSSLCLLLFCPKARNFAFGVCECIHPGKIAGTVATGRMILAQHPQQRHPKPLLDGHMMHIVGADADHQLPVLTPVRVPRVPRTGGGTVDDTEFAFTRLMGVNVVHGDPGVGDKLLVGVQPV